MGMVTIMKIEKIMLKNFRSIKNQEIETSKIVGIWGRNSVGKSSLLQAIIIALKNRGQVTGNGLRFSNFGDISYGKEGLPIEIGIDVDFAEGQGRQVRQINYLFKSKDSFSHTGVKFPKPDKIQYFPPWRHIGARSGRIDQIVNGEIGLNGNSIHTFIHRYLYELLGRSHRGDTIAKKTIDEIDDWSTKFGIGPLFDEQTSGSNVSTIFKDDTIGKNLNLIDGGYGGNSFLPIILQGYHDDNLILLIEEPEISLHPAAQSEAWDLIMEFALKRGHQIFFTSHSEYLLKKAVKSIVDGKISNDDVSLLFARKDKVNGTTFDKLNDRPLNELLANSYWQLDLIEEVEKELRDRTK